MVDIRKPLNVFAQSVNVGQIAEISAAGPESQTVMVDPEAHRPIYPGRPVMLVPGYSQVPLVKRVDDPDTDPIYGLALFNPKVGSWVANDVLQVTTPGTVIFLESSGSLSRGDQVGLTSNGHQIQAATLANYIGQLLDDASSDDIVRVEIAVPIRVSKASA